ncbi:MAG: DsbC family protein [Pseudomonadota bacterium]
MSSGTYRIISIAILAIASGTAFVLASGQGGEARETANAVQLDVRAAVETRFAETEVDEVNCDGFGPLCEVVAGKTVFYVDPEARHAFIGRLFNLDEKADLTEATLQRLGPQPDIIEPDLGAPTTFTAAWDDLPFESAIVRNKGGERKVAVFSDLNCGYCRNLSVALEEAPDIEVHEFLVGQIGSEAASQAIGCSDNPSDAITEYFRTHQAPAAQCARDIVTPARAAAQAINMRGTPTFVRSDGAITSGFRDIASLRAWIDAGVSITQPTEASQ